MNDHIDPQCGPGTGTPNGFTELPESYYTIPEDTGPNGMAVGELLHYLHWIRADDDLDSLEAKIPWASWKPTVGSRSIVGDLSSMRQFGAGYAISKGDDPRAHSVSLTIGFNNFPELAKTMRSACGGGHFVSDPPSYLVAASVERGQTGFEVEHSWWRSVGHLYEMRGDVRTDVFQTCDASEATCFLTVTKYFWA